MNGLFASGAWCLARPNGLAIAAVVVFSVLWIMFNGPLEGRVLWTVSPDRGLTESDFLAFGGFAVAAWGVRTLRASTGGNRHRLGADRRDDGAD